MTAPGGGVLMDNSDNSVEFNIQQQPGESGEQLADRINQGLGAFRSEQEGERRAVQESFVPATP